MPLMMAALALVAASCGSKTAKTAAAPVEQTPKVVVATVMDRDVPQIADYTSTVEANVINNIAPQGALRIKKIKAEIGDFVGAGQILAEMDVANLEQTRLQLINDSTELSRIKALYEVGGVAKSDLDAIQLSYNVRKTAYQNLLENTILRSPISGVVTARNYDKGDMYTMGQPIYTVQEITPVKMLVAISEKDYTKVKKGDAVTLSVDAYPDQVFNGTIKRLYPTMDPTTHTFQAEVTVANANRLLRPGMYAKVKVNLGTNHSVVIPDKALVKQQGSGDKFVYSLNADGTVSYKKVVPGIRMGSEYEILEGVEPGEKLVVEGHSRLRHGSKVQVTEE